MSEVSRKVGQSLVTSGGKEEYWTVSGLQRKQVETD